MPTQLDIDFLQLHRDADPVKLLLASSKHPEIDMPWVAQQLEGRVQARTKWPSMAENDQVWFPPRINREQSSSEALARYKAIITTPCDSVADLTGGFGIDTKFLAQNAKTVDYVEINPGLCQLAQHNFAVLGDSNIACHCTDSIEWIQTQGVFDVVFIDPARRDEHGRKVSAFEDCTPNLLDNLDLLLDHCQRLVVKASPMISIFDGIAQLGRVTQVDVVALSGECKEVIFTLKKDPAEVQFHAVDILAEGRQVALSFMLSDEANAVDNTHYCSQVGKYLYEPNAAVMKAGCYHLVAQRFGLAKLARNTHIYTSNDLIEDFPGRVFEIQSEVKPKQIGRLLPEKKAHVAVRNYPLSANDLQKKLRIQEGGSLFVIGTTVATTPNMFLCKRIK